MSRFFMVHCVEVEMMHMYIYRTTTLHITYQPGIRTNHDVNCLQYSYIIC